MKFPTLAVLQIFIILIFRTKSFTWPMFSPVLLVDWHPECSSSSTEVTLVSNMENTQKLVFSTLPALQNYFHHFKSLHRIFTSIKQNVMVSCCFYKSVIFCVCWHFKWNNTHLYFTSLNSHQICHSPSPSKK